jgi:hypothetical protein
MPPRKYWAKYQEGIFARKGALQERSLLIFRQAEIKLWRYEGSVRSSKTHMHIHGKVQVRLRIYTGKWKYMYVYRGKRKYNYEFMEKSSRDSRCFWPR